MHRPVNWDDLQVFLAIARHGRVSSAARRLGVEHTTVSRRLAALEEQLGARLFYRTPGGYLLTPQGQHALADAESMERAAVAVAARAREKSGEIAGRVRLALPPEFASHWLAPELDDFRAQHPRIVLQILVGTRQLDLSRGEAELAVRSPRPRQQGLVTARIARTSAALYASRKVGAYHRLRITTISNVKDVPLFVFTPALHMLQEAAWFQPLLDSGSIALETNSTHTLLAAALAGAGAAVLPRFVARRHEDLVAVSDDVASHDVWLTTHPEFRRDPRVRVTADFLKAIGGALA